MSLGIENERLKRNTEIIKKQEQKYIFAKEKRRIHKIPQPWIALFTFLKTMNIISQKYLKQERTQIVYNEYLGKLTICLYFLGKLLRKWKLKKLATIAQAMNRLFEGKGSILKHHLRNIHRKQIGKFINSYYRGSEINIVIKHVIRDIHLIQRWYKWRYMKKSVLLGLMIREWSAIEFVLVKEKNSMRDKKIYDIIDDSINKRNRANYISLNRRIKYINSYFEVCYLITYR